MKKLLYNVAVLALAFSAGSCQRENLEPVAANGTVTYTVQVPGAIATKANDGVNNVDKLVYEVYRTAGEKVTTFSDTDNCLYHREAEVKNGKAEIALEFVNDQNFTVLFWAYDSSTNVYNVDDLTNVTIASTVAANTHETAAFTGVDFVVNCVSEKGGNVSLTRPVAQLNIATTDASLKMDETVIGVSESYVKVYGLSTSFNVATQEAGATEGDNTYASAAIPGGTFAGYSGYTHLGMNYLGFVPSEGTTVKVDYILKTTEGDIDNTIDNIPVKPNYRTNIIGNLISGTQDYNVTLDAEWSGVAAEVEIWDGENKVAPEVVDSKYIIKKASEFAWLEAPQVLSYDVELASNIDMGGNKFQGILSNGKKFDGAGYTLMNVTLDYTSQDWSSLFVTGGGNGSNSKIDVQNLTVDGAYVVAKKYGNGNAAVIASYAEATLNIENVKVKNSTVNGTQSIGALVGHVTGSGNATIKNCAIDNVTLSTFDVPGESGNIGGVVGRVTGKCTIENTKISNSVINAYVNDGSMTDQKRTVSKYIGNFYGGSAELNVTNGSIDNVTINLLNDLAQTQSCLYTEYLGGWRTNGGSVSINGVEITKDQTNEDITIDTPAELATAISNAADGAVIPVSGEIATTELKAGDGKSITIVGMSDDATIDVKANNSYTNTSGNITFQNLTIKLNSNPAYHYSVGFHNNGGKHVYDNCKFEGCITAWGDCTYNNCEFVNNTKGKYAAWVYAGTVVYNNCTFSGNDRAAKVFNENPNSGLNVTYNNCTFKSSTPNKTAVEVAVENNSNKVTFVAINNATVENMGTAEHYAIGESVCNLESYGKDNAGNNIYGLGIVNLNGKGYSVAHTAAQLQALANAGKDVTIELAQDITGDVTILQQVGADVVIDGCAVNYDGSITIDGDNRNTGVETLTISNINFATSDENTFISAPGELNGKKERYSHNITIDGCTFSTPSFNEGISAISTQKTYNFTVKNCSATNLHSLLQVQSCDNKVYVENVTVTGCKNGISFGNTAFPTLINADIECLGYGVRGDGDASRGKLVMKNVDITAAYPLTIRKMKTNSYSVELAGENTLTATSTNEYQVIFTNNSEESVIETPTGTYSITGADNFKVYPRDNQ